MNLADLRRQIPELEGLDDASAVDAIQQAYYPDIDRQQIASRLGVKLAAPEAPAPKKRSLWAVANDTVIEAGNAAAGAVGSAADFISPGNRVSKFIDENIIRPGEASQSDVVQQSRKQFQDEVEASDGIGDELMAVGRKVLRDPLLTAAQAAGSFVIPGAAVKGGNAVAGALGAGARGMARGGMAGGAVAGAALAGGDAAGTAYDLVIKAGGTEEEATAAARQASALPAAVGAAGGLVGAERLLAGAGGMKGGLMARALKTAGVEGAQEGFEEGITQYEGQRAAAPYDPSIDPMKGVGAAAGMGAVMGGAIGGGTSLLTPNHPEVATKRLAEADNVPDMIGAAEDLAMAPLTPAVKPRAAGADAMAEIRQLDPEQQQEALGLLGTAGNMQAPGHVRRFAQNRLDELLQPFRQVPVGEATEMLPVGEVTELAAPGENERRAAETLKRWMVNAEPVDEARATEMVAKAAEMGKDFAVVPHTRGGFTVVPQAWLTPGMADRLMAEQRASQWEGGRIPVGEAADMIPTGEVVPRTRKIPTGEATEIDAEQIEATDPNAPKPRAPRTRTDAVAIDPAGPNAVAQYVERQRAVNTPAARAFVQDFEAGRITPSDVMHLLVPRQDQGPDADQRLARAASQAPTVQPGDLLTADGMPYGTKAAASVRATREGGGDVVQVPGGFVVRKESADVNQHDMAGTAAVPAAAPAGGGADAGGGVGDVRYLAGAGAGQRDAAAGAPAGSGGPAAAVGDGDQQRDAALSDDLPTLKKQWAEAVRANDNALAKRINDHIVELKKNPEQRTASPVAESQAPDTAQALETGDGGVATTRAGGAPELPPKAEDYPNAASYHAAVTAFRAANPVTRPANAVTPKRDRRAEIKRELAALQDKYTKRMNRKDSMAPPAIKADALRGIARQMDKLDAELKALDAPPATPLKDRVDAKRQPGPSAEMVADERAAGGNPHTWAGRGQFKAGFPRTLPPEYADKNSANAKAWFKGWDDAQAEAKAQPDAAAPDEKAPPQGRVPVAAAPEDAIARLEKMTPQEREDWAHWWGVGGNAGVADALTISGREQALQSVGEPIVLAARRWNVLPILVRGKLLAVRDGKKAEAAAPSSAPTLLEARNQLIELRSQAEGQGRVVDDRLLERVRRQEKLVRELEAEAAEPAAQPKPDKAEIRPYRRADGSIGYEAVPIVEERKPEPAADDGWVEGNDTPNPRFKTWTKVLDDGRELQVLQTGPRTFNATNAQGRPGSGAFGTLAEAKAAAKPSVRADSEPAAEVPRETPAEPAKPEAAPKPPVGPYAQWRDSTPAQRRELLRGAGYTDSDQARALSGVEWNQLTDPVRRALSAAAAGPASEAEAPKPKRPPKSFRKKVKVTTQVFVEETASFEAREVDADAALTALDADINEMDAFVACLKG